MADPEILEESYPLPILTQEVIEATGQEIGAFGEDHFLHQAAERFTTSNRHAFFIAMGHILLTEGATEEEILKHMTVVTLFHELLLRQAIADRVKTEQ